MEARDKAGTVKYCEEAKKHGLVASEAALAFAEEAIGEVETRDGGVQDVAEPVLQLSSAEGAVLDIVSIKGTCYSQLKSVSGTAISSTRQLE